MAKSKKEKPKKPFAGQVLFQFRVTKDVAESIREESRRLGMSDASWTRQVVLGFVQRMNPTAVVVDAAGKNPPARLALQLVGSIDSGDRLRNYRVKNSPPIADAADAGALPWWVGTTAVYVLDSSAWKLTRSFWDMNSRRYDIVLERQD